MLDPGDVRLSRSLFAQETPVVARALLGRDVVHRLPSGACLRGRIVETEAYHGQDDTASHARFGRTGRSALMFGPPGHAYVYLIYGMYEMLNVTANPEDFPGAVLIRALEPLEGIEHMLERRGSRMNLLTNGPGRLCRAMEIDRSLNGIDLVRSDVVWLERGVEVSDAHVAVSPRVGIGYADPIHRDLNWRFSVRGNRWVSK